VSVRSAAEPGVAARSRFRLSRAGVLNVWQYDDQVFECADGRLLLRGANGAGKSKTLEMLLPFALDGDKMRITASGRHHTSLVWLMTDGYEGNRTGYLWVEFRRDADDADEVGDGSAEYFTCGVGIRASSFSRSAQAWFFTSPRRVGEDLQLEDEAGPLSKDRCRAAVAGDGHFFERGRDYKHHVGRALFGLEPPQYDELLRLLYWLRQPQVGEDIEPGKLAEQLAQALPPVDDEAVRSAGDTFDELAAFGEQIDRRQRAVRAISVFADAYAAYATGVVRQRAAGLVDAYRERGRRSTALNAAVEADHAAEAEVEDAEQQLAETLDELARARAREAELSASPEARSHQRLTDLEARAAELAAAAERAASNARYAADRAEASGAGVAADAESIVAAVRHAAAESEDAAAAATRAGVTSPAAPPGGLLAPQLEVGDDAAGLLGALSAHAAALEAVRPAVGELVAAVQVVDDARRSAEDAARRAEAEDGRAAEAEQRAETARARREDAAGVARTEEADLLDALARWRSDPRAVAVELPELTAATVAELPRLAREAAAAEVAEQRQRRDQAAGERVEGERRLAALRDRRSGIEAETDPAPPAPSLARSPRSAVQGAPLWRLVDFAPGLEVSERARLEAALESSGLLDAWVRPDGSVIEAGRLDTVLPLGSPAPEGRTLAEALVPDVHDGGPVAADVVTVVLRRIGLSDRPAGSDGLGRDGSGGDGSGGDGSGGDGSGGDGSGGGGSAGVGLDGSWRLGPLVGRADKPAAQYVGATARAAERARRLAEIDSEIGRVDDARSAAAQREALSAGRLDDLDAWLQALPSHQPVLQAWAVLDERTAAADEADAQASRAEGAARAARSDAATRRQSLQQLGARYSLPTTEEGLGARRRELELLDQRVQRRVEALAPLADRIRRWARDWAAWQEDSQHAGTLDDEARTQARAATEAAEQLATLRETVGAQVRELQRRLRETRGVISEAVQRERRLRTRLEGLHEARGSARTAVRSAQQRLDDHEPTVLAAAHGLADLGEVPGLLGSAVGRPVAEEESVALASARGTTPGSRVPATAVDLARRLAALPEPRRATDQAALLAAWQDAASSDAADHEPSLRPGPGEIMAALGRDDGGEHPVAVLADRLAAAVARDRELLTDRERTLFEEHLIGDLGEELRRRRLDAAELVEAMNRLLTGVTTSQGIAVRLQWQLRDDVPADARRSVELLGRSIGALLPSERSELRDALHRLIEASRAEAPEESYAEHLAKALDYRRWHVFRIRYTRPEQEGRWLDLHRRSPLSQGEQKVVCYLPLFAAAAAHFTSLAGAAPHAPRFVLLDDAFPKIDVRTHPLLFGLLVSLDLDFVVTSERLWGDHDTVPSLAIYEALRDPGERGIAQYRYTWDGARLQAVGA
jgi:Putative exonuclease SbcCD, C subunit